MANDARIYGINNGNDYGVRIESNFKDVEKSRYWIRRINLIFRINMGCSTNWLFLKNCAITFELQNNKINKKA